MCAHRCAQMHTNAYTDAHAHVCTRPLKQVQKKIMNWHMVQGMYKATAKQKKSGRKGLLDY